MNCTVCGAAEEHFSGEECVETLKSKLDVAVSALRRHGYRESCDIPACNCGDQWSHGGHAAERLRELAEVLYENGKTPLQAAKGLVDRLEASENRWKLAMDRLHNRFGDSLAVHMADIKALMALGDQREAVTGGVVEIGRLKSDG